MSLTENISTIRVSVFVIRFPRSFSNEKKQQTGKFYHYRSKNGSISEPPRPGGVRTPAGCHDPPRPGGSRIEGVNTWFLHSYLSHDLCLVS